MIDEFSLTGTGLHLNKNQKKESSQLKTQQMNATINATHASAQKTKIEALNATLLNLTTTMQMFKDDHEMTKKIKDQIQQQMVKIAHVIQNL